MGEKTDRRFHDNKPNIVIMYADDLGFGDLGCYGASAIPTPHVDKLAAQGLQLTQGYAAAATCTPSRYSLLTGSYPWRHENAYVLAGDAPLIIPPGSPTLASMLQAAGYATGVVGKWHLGLGQGDLDWNRRLSRTPLDVGFDYSFIMAATNDRVPCVYIEGRHVVGLDPDDPIEVIYAHENPFPELPTGRDNPERLRMKHSHGHDMTIVNGIGRIGYMRGGKAALWKDEEMAEVFLDRATSFVRHHKDQPFFLYYALHQPHVPRVPGVRFAGTTDLGPRGDVIVEMDWCVGQMMQTLDELGLTENTIVIFTSDNGPVLDDGYEDGAALLNRNHKPAGELRGGKYSLFDGGTRVPFVVSWPAQIEPGHSSAFVGQIDLYASLASMLNQGLQPGEAPDSFDMLQAFTGNDGVGRREMVLEGTRRKKVLRQNDWVFIPPHDGPPHLQHVDIESGNAPVPQLYHLGDDIGQQSNLADTHPDVVSRMNARLQEIVAGSSTRP